MHESCIVSGVHFPVSPYKKGDLYGGPPLDLWEYFLFSLREQIFWGKFEPNLVRSSLQRNRAAASYSWFVDFGSAKNSRFYDVSFERKSSRKKIPLHSIQLLGKSNRLSLKYYVTNSGWYSFALHFMFEFSSAQTKAEALRVAPEILQISNFRTIETENHFLRIEMGIEIESILYV